MGGHIGNAATFLIETFFGIYILIVMLRLLLQWARADFYNPLSQFIVKATQPVLAPLRTERSRPIGRIDLGCIVLLVVAPAARSCGWSPGCSGSGRSAGIDRPARATPIAEIVQLATYVFLFSILIQVIMSWITPAPTTPLLGVLHSLNEPLLGQARRIVPPIEGSTFRRIVVMVALQLVAILVVGPLRQIAGTLG